MLQVLKHPWPSLPRLYELPIRPAINRTPRCVRSLAGVGNNCSVSPAVRRRACRAHRRNQGNIQQAATAPTVAAITPLCVSWTPLLACARASAGEQRRNTFVLNILKERNWLGLMYIKPCGERARAEAAPSGANTLSAHVIALARRMRAPRTAFARGRLGSNANRSVSSRGSYGTARDRRRRCPPDTGCRGPRAGSSRCKCRPVSRGKAWTCRAVPDSPVRRVRGCRLGDA